ncbi:MAG: xanthine dehydrogenase family protein subunit M [Pseudomonadales bacterium]|jgi:carbon-monoxide dehydrogenase medium subunit|nr:xanthine dehydrogenase family protein subunit M [Pseudomonadales bacterium]
MYDFNYHKPSSIDEAVALFIDLEDAVYLAGGHTLLPSLKLRLAAPTDVIDLAGIPGLGDIDYAGDDLTIGALTAHDDVATSPVVQSVIPALSALAAGIGDAQVRNRGTIGGSVANSDPAADYPAAVLGLDATLVTNQRSIAVDEFFTGMFETVLEEGELLTAIRFPKPEAAAYVKYPNPASRYATVGVFIARTTKGVRVAITGAAPSVFRATEMEAALNVDFSENALAGISLDADMMNEDLHASAEYRAHLCTVMARRAVAQLS